MAGLLDIFGSVKPKITIRTQITPDIGFDLAPGQKPKVEPKPGIGGKLGMFILRSVIKPQIVLRAGGQVVKNYAPFGEPKENLALPLVAGIGIGALGFGAIAYLWCKNS
jgi:hypothetical protein